MVINQENDDKYCVTAYNRVLDKERFEEQIIGGEAGYYDNVEKVFIPERVFLSLFKEIMPEVDDHSVDNNYEVHLDSLVQKSTRRVSRYLQIASQATNRDSYSQIFLAYLSRRFLLHNKNKRELMAILYIDLVGSTTLSSIISSEQLAMLIRLFCQEMSIVISKYNGYVLKYAGDAIIGYFPQAFSVQNACENALRCSFAMKQILEKSITELLFRYGYPKLMARIAIDAGENQIVVLGSEPDLLGHIISRAAKIMAKAKPNQIVIGEKVFINLHPDLRKKFENNVDRYTLAATGETYTIYLSV